MIDEIKKLSLPIIVIDENSTDKTIEIARSKGVEVYQRDGSGKGAGVISAIKIAEKQGYMVIVLIDCDATYSPTYIPELLKYFPENDMVIGSRNIKSVRLLHRMPNMIHTQLINILFNANLHDINSGLRAIKISKIKTLLNAHGFDIEAQITIKALKHKFRIKEIAIEYNKRLGSSKIRIKDGFVILGRIIKERIIRR